METVDWLWKEGRINEGERREWWGRWRRDREEGRRREDSWGGETENGSFTGGTVDRRVDKGMGGKDGGRVIEKDGGWMAERAE